MSSHPKLRVGLLLDSLDVPAWVHAMLARIRESDYAELALVVLNGARKGTTGRLLNLIKNPPTWAYTLYRRLDSMLFRPGPDAFARRDASPLLAGIPALKIAPVRTGQGDRIDAVDDIREHNIDVLIQLGFNNLEGEILTAARFGVWSYRRGENVVARDGLAGFWEVFTRQPVTVASLHALADDRENVPVLYRSHLGTVFSSVARNRSRLCWRNLACTTRTLKQLHELGAADFFEKLKREDEGTSEQIRTEAPATGEFLKLFSSYTWRWARQGLQQLFSFNQWILMVSPDDGIPESVSGFHKLLPPRDRSWADPFIVYRDDTYFIFVEEANRKDRKGRISLIEMDGSFNCKASVKLIERPYHLSYPFIFRWNGDDYMIPESAANRTIEVYKCAEFPEKWTYHRTLMDDVKAVDTTLLYHDDRWWLFASMAEHEGGTTREELFLFYGDHPLSDTWNPHPQNPVVSDVRRARPAGRIFRRSGSLYRPSQNCSIRYGHSLQINRIDRLSATEYAEEEIRSFEPEPDSGIIAMHTLNRAPGLSVMDAKLRRWRWWNPTAPE